VFLSGICETRFFRATGSQYREPLARGGQSQRRGVESHRIKHNCVYQPESEPPNANPKVSRLSANVKASRTGQGGMNRRSYPAQKTWMSADQQEPRPWQHPVNFDWKRPCMPFCHKQADPSDGDAS